MLMMSFHKQDRQSDSSFPDNEFSQAKSAMAQPANMGGATACPRPSHIRTRGITDLGR
jgi:hypothetical protein